MRKQEPKAWLAIFKFSPPKDEQGNVLDVKDCWECDNPEYLVVRAISNHTEYYLIYSKTDKKARIVSKMGEKMYGQLEPTPEIVNIWCEDYEFSKEMAEDGERYEKERLEEEKQLQEQKDKIAKITQAVLDASPNKDLIISGKANEEQTKEFLKDLKSEILKGAKPFK